MNTKPRYKLRTHTVSLARENERDLTPVNSGDDAAAILKAAYQAFRADMDRENFGVLCLNARGCAVAFKIVATGTLTSCVTEPGGRRAHRPSHGGRQDSRYPDRGSRHPRGPIQGCALPLDRDWIAHMLTPDAETAQEMCACGCEGKIADHDERSWGPWPCPRCSDDSDTDLGVLCSRCRNSEEVTS